MISEPYINRQTGEIEWHSDDYKHHYDDNWIPYADHERDVLKRLGHRYIEMRCGWGYYLTEQLSSHTLIGYAMNNWEDDTESGRLLKRAEFLKAVCEKENVEWLENNKWCGKEGYCHMLIMNDETRTCVNCRQQIPKPLDEHALKRGDEIAKGSTPYDNPIVLWDEKVKRVRKIWEAELEKTRRDVDDLHLKFAKSFDRKLEKRDKEEKEQWSALLDFLGEHMAYGTSKEDKAKSQFESLRKKFL